MKELIQEITLSNFCYILFNSLTVIGLLFASVSSLWNNDLEILNKSYLRNPVIKFYEHENKKQILNIPISIIKSNIKESTSLFVGFITSFLGTTLNLLFESDKGKNVVQINILIAVMCIVLFFVLKLIVFIICSIRINVIKNKIINQRISFPDVYSSYKTDNKEGKGISVQMCGRNCEIECEYAEDEK